MIFSSRIKVRLFSLSVSEFYSREKQTVLTQLKFNLCYCAEMKLFISILQVIPTIWSMPENRQVFISKREADEIFREKRFVFADNLETECIEDKCSQRELEECFDFETGLVKVDC